MSVEFSWAAPTTAVNVIDSTGSSGDASGADLKTLATNGYVISTVITPVAPRPLFCSYLAKGKLGAAVTGVPFLKGWFLDITDGTNQVSDNGTNAPTNSPDFIIYWPTVSSVGPFVMRSTPRIIQRPPWPYKILLQNSSGQTTTSVNNDNVLYEVTIDELGT
jgi:hypothetical protein